MSSRASHQTGIGPSSSSNVQRREAPGGAGDSVRGHVRGMSFEDGAAALTPVQRTRLPVQMKDDKGADTDKGATTDAASTEEKKPGDGVIPKYDRGLVGLGNLLHLGEVFDKVLDYAVGFVIGPGSAVKFAAEGSFPLMGVLGFKVGAEVEVAQTPDGKWESKLKLGLGAGLLMDVEIASMLDAGFVAMICRDYVCEGKGDSLSEVMRFQRLGIERSMRVAAGQIAPPEEAHATEKQKGWWHWLCDKVGAVYNLVAALPSFVLVGMIWGFDVDNYNEREQAALAKMDGDDEIATTVMNGAEVGAKLDVEGLVEMEGAGKTGYGEKTTLTKGANGKMNASGEESDFVKIGAKYDFGGFIAKWEYEQFGKEGELVLEGKGHIASLCNATVVVGGLKAIVGIINKASPKLFSDKGKGVLDSLIGVTATVTTVVASEVGGGGHDATHVPESGTGHDTKGTGHDTHSGGEHEGVKNEGGLELKLKVSDHGMSIAAIEVFYEKVAKMLGMEASATYKTSLYHGHEHGGNDTKKAGGHGTHP